MSLRHHGHGGYLSRSSYGNKRAALFHLFRLHNRLGYPAEFGQQLGNLFKGFFRNIARQAPRQQEAPAAGAGAAGGAPQQQQQQRHKEGKDPISVELYQALCRWFLEWGTIDGVFAYCFTVLTWNLACRANNTCEVRFSQMSWSTSFDSFEIFFGHTKTDQGGDESKYPRHIYANPLSPLHCPVFALSVYFACCFNTMQTSNGFLFPGKDQYQQYSDQLQRVLKDHAEEVQAMGFNVQDLGTHSVRKGVVS